MGLRARCWGSWRLREVEEAPGGGGSRLLLPIPYSLFPIPYSLFPIPHSPPIAQYIRSFQPFDVIFRGISGSGRRALRPYNLKFPNSVRFKPESDRTPIRRILRLSNRKHQ